VSIANAIDYRELEMSGKVLGSGAFGVVKMAMFRGRKVAVKEIKPDNVDERELKAFVEEAELMQQLDQHENVVGFIGVVVDPFCIVSEFMGKGDLNSYLMSDVAIPDMMKTKILLDIAKGMNFLAKQGIVHRDLAARNILLDDNMNAKVSDFGLSRLLDTESAVYTKSATGPVKWMAPEQLTKRKASEKSDVWMYGVLIFEVVTRGPPYPNMNLTEVCVSVANNQLRPIFPSNTPDILVQLTDHIFQYDPNYRPTFADIVVRLSSADDKSGYVLAQ
jgi:serine/threonine protein kinase